jgi:hypothetical protein
VILGDPRRYPERERLLAVAQRAAGEDPEALMPAMRGVGRPVITARSITRLLKFT